MNNLIEFFASCPKNIEPLLEEELQSFGITQIKKTVAGVHFRASLKDTYKVCLWSRLANRILLPLITKPIRDTDDLYALAHDINWLDHFTENNTFLVECAGHSPQISNTHFASLRVKDAIVDYMRGKKNTRPSIDKDNPDIRVHIYLHGNEASISLDLSGDSLHKRGYRTEAGEAPIKENLAAAVLMRAGWLKACKENMPLIDPMCGSGTLLIEAFMMAAEIAPGILRQQFAFHHWLEHIPKIWNDLKAEAIERANENVKKKYEFIGFDQDAQLIEKARRNLANVADFNFLSHIRLLAQDIQQLKRPPHLEKGMLISNLPYGHRLGDGRSLAVVFNQFGKILKNEFPSWRAALLTTHQDLPKILALSPQKKYHFFNGTIPCDLMLFDLHPPK